MHLLERYSLAAGAKISKPHVNTAFYPLETDKYIVLSPFSSNMPAKNYKFFNIVLDLIAPELKKNGISIIHLGGPNEPQFKHANYLAGQTTFAQSAFIVKGALAVLGIDSFLTHVASAFNVPIVSLYGVSSPTACGPYWGDKEKQILLEPNFKAGETYYYAPQGPDVVNTITPERVVESLGKILGLEFPAIKTERVGQHFNLGLIDIIPNCAINQSSFPEKPLSIRYDKGGEANWVYQQLSLRRCVVVTDKVLDINILKQLAPNVERLIYLVKDDNSNPDFCMQVARLGISVGLISRLPEDKINNLKLDYSDIGIIERVPEGEKPEGFAANWRFKTGKRIISNSKIYLSYAHEMISKNIDNVTIDDDNVIDSPEFWLDIENYYIYAQR